VHLKNSIITLTNKWGCIFTPFTVYVPLNCNKWNEINNIKFWNIYGGNKPLDTICLDKNVIFWTKKMLFLEKLWVISYFSHHNTTQLQSQSLFAKANKSLKVIFLMDFFAPSYFCFCKIHRGEWIFPKVKK